MLENGDVLIPQTGEVIPADKVTLNDEGFPVLLPSEFAGAEKV